MISDTHEGIVTQEEFDTVQQLMTSRRREQNAGGFENIFSGVIKCADCGYAMRAASANRRKRPDICNIKIQLERFNDDYYDVYRRYLNKEHNKIVQMNKKNESKRLEFYEQYVSGEIDADEYQRMIERVSVVEKELLARQKEIEKSSKMTEKLCKKNYLWLSEFTKGINTEYLTKESVSAYINKITLYEDKRIEIEFKLQDELLELAKKLEEGVVRCQMISA